MFVKALEAVLEKVPHASLKNLQAISGAAQQHGTVPILASVSCIESEPNDASTIHERIQHSSRPYLARLIHKRVL